MYHGMWLVVISVLFGCVTCFWHEQCDIIPADGCSCYDVTGYPEVICQGLNLVEIPTFDNIESSVGILVNIDISYNKIEHLIVYAFGEILINKLDLSHNLQAHHQEEDILTKEQRKVITAINLSNNLFHECPVWIKKLHSLAVLDLSYNQIDFIEGPNFRGLNKLAQLSLIGNPITLVASNTFRHVHSLVDLGISFSNQSSQEHDIQDLFQDDDLDRLRNNLKVLSLVDSTITSLVFLDLFEELESVTLRNCGLQDSVVMNVDPYTVKYYHETVKYVDMSYNMIVSFPHPLLELCFKLEHLELSHNLIVSLGPEVDFFVYDHLTYLDVSHNTLEHVSSRQLSRFPAVTHLDLSFNDVTSLGDDIMQSVPELEFLDISNNQLMTILQISFPDGFPTQLTMSITNNRFVCKHATEWFLDAVGRQADTGSGPFDWFDVYNTKCLLGGDHGPRYDMLEVYYDKENLLITSPDFDLLEEYLDELP